MERYATLFFWVFLLSLVALLVTIRAPFHVLEYPWLFPDSFDWLWNAFSYAAAGNQSISHRGMFFSLLGGIAYRLGLEDSLTLFGTVAFFAAVVAQFYGMRRIVGDGIALLSAVLLAGSANFIEQSAYIGCDVAATAWLIAAFSFYLRFLKTNDLRELGIAAFAFVCGLHTQYIGAIVLPVFVVSWFLSLDSNGPLWSFERVRMIRRSPLAYFAIGCGSLLVFLTFLLPRWIEFRLLYEEKVNHTSLVTPVWNLPYYAAGLVSTVTWPILLFSVIGCAALLRSGEHRRVSLVLLGWFALVFGFFAFSYQWKDVRLLIYLFPPCNVFAAAGVLAVAARFRRRNAAAVLIALPLMTAAQLRTAPSAFDNVFYLTPARSYSMKGDGILEREDVPMRMLLLSTIDFVNKYRRSLDEGDVDGVMLSEPAARLLSKLGRSRPIARLPIVFFQKVFKEGHYILRNRNRLYARREMKTVQTWKEVESEAKESPIVVVMHSRDIPEARAESDLPRLFARHLGKEGDWQAGIVVPGQVHGGGER